MRYSFAMGMLLFAAILEAGGDALMRLGLHSSTATRAVLFILSEWAASNVVWLYCQRSAVAIWAPHRRLCRLFLRRGAVDFLVRIPSKALPHAPAGRQPDRPGRMRGLSRQLIRALGPFIETGGRFLREIAQKPLLGDVGTWHSRAISKKRSKRPIFSIYHLRGSGSRQSTLAMSNQVRALRGTLRESPAPPER